MNRTRRQERLREVGKVGQARIRSSVARVTSKGDAALIEALYLAGAGFGTIVVPSESIAAHIRALDPDANVQVDLPLCTESDSSTPAPDSLFEGAYAALIQFRSAVRRDE